MPAKPKTGAKVGAKAKREAIAKVFGDVPVDSENMNFLYSRRHLETVRERGRRELNYIVEFDELEMLIWKTLDRIRDRDGERIFTPHDVAMMRAGDAADRIEDYIDSMRARGRCENSRERTSGDAQRRRRMGRAS
jgi:hypothetical protein